MTVYVVAQLTFKDRPAYDRYQANFFGVFRKFKGRLLAADENPVVLEGEWRADKIVMMSFEDRDECMRFLDSPEYALISRDRKAGADAVALVVEGISVAKGA